MSKNLFLVLAIFCQALFCAKNKAASSVFVDPSVPKLTLDSSNPNPETYHLFSHGRPGELLVEHEWLNAAQIAKRFKNELRGKSELYVYGCNFAQGEKGLAAVAYLENALNISVSASTNITGIDGDWILEAGRGKRSLSVKNFKNNLQLDTTHYLNPIVAGAYTTSTISEEYIYLSTPSAANITVQMSYAAATTAPRVSVTNITTGVVTYVADGKLIFNNGNPIRLQFVNPNNSIIAPGTTPITVPLNTSGTVIPGTAQGLIFKANTAADKFYVNYRARSTPQAGSVLTKGTVALGKEFRWGGSPVEFPTTITETGNMLSILATEDDTKIIISNIKTGTKFVNGTAGTTLVGPNITRTLKKGESFILYAPVQNNVLSIQDTGWLGAKVLSDKNISVVVGGLMQQGNSADNRDIGLDQLVPKERLGLEHVIMQGNGGSAEKVIVVATEDNTAVFVNGNANRVATLLKAGDYFLIPSTYFINKNMFVRVSQPSYIFHKIFGSDRINTNSLMFIPPLSCFGQKQVDLVPDANKIGTTAYTGTELVVLAAAGVSNKPVATLNGIALATSSPNTGGVVTGNANWVTYRYPIASNGNVKVTSAGTIQAEIIGANGDAGFGGYYSGFGETPIYTITLDTTYLYPCVGKSRLSVPAGLGTYQWYRNDESISGATMNSYTLNPINDGVSADYYVIITFSGGCTVRSNELSSDICPCTKPGATGTPASYTDFGISIRDKRSTANWPKDVPNGFITMEANNKGFVITRIETPETSILNPVLGMLVYDTTVDCLKLYNGTSWSCIKQTCND
ncbi:DUF4347 domain-containing protein [Kaistella sp. 97-N-M2]|uniref:DUF4347 domain-containing protein n=1 Tax=Kaistella sp. 97-N-M2 TaxID=2908645 RepID=UPI001F3CEFD9|nr:DUF4347 domain-containing protein [Kaistella sp. 97-N-M2]UJF28644.1 DUF4347 domain-containing protein [Kaistella sp. 97-N-M2]